MESQETTSPVPVYRSLFVKNERNVIPKSEELTLDELRSTCIAWNTIQNSKTTPKAHYELIDDIITLLNAERRHYTIDKIYAANQGGTTVIRNIEENYAIPKILQSWQLMKITGAIILSHDPLPSFEGDDDEFRTTIAFSWHDRGIDIAFGQKVSICSNMAIFGHKVLHTYGQGKIEYEKIMENLWEWIKNSKELELQDRQMIRTLVERSITKKQAIEFIGRLLLLAAMKTNGESVVAPLSINQVSLVSQMITDAKCKMNPMSEDEGLINLWDFYNSFTFVLKAEEGSNISTLLTDVSEIGNMIINQFITE